ncbi:MAG: hypothetical protein Q9176_000813 [Flavoplaca citrina]
MALDLLKAKHHSLETVLSNITDTLETCDIRQQGTAVETFHSRSHTPEPYDATTHHLLTGHESLRRDVDRMSMEMSNLDAKARTMILNESLHTKDELSRANAAISSIRMQLNWLTSPNHQREFSPRFDGASASLDFVLLTILICLLVLSAYTFKDKSNRIHKLDMPYPQTLEENPKIIFFTDFDGTITLKDSRFSTTMVFLHNLGFGEKLRKQGNADTLNGTVTFRESFWDMMESVKTPFPDCIRLLCENIKLDPYFKDFYQWSRMNKVPVIVLSSGMTPIIRSLLVHLVGPEAKDIEIVSNEVVDKPGKTKDQEDGWQLKYHDDSGFGHDKSLTIRPYAKHFAARPNEPRPTMLYAGDGVSDLSAARETDLLFAKKGHDLITYCEREGIPFTVFEDWQSILATTKDILEGRKSLKSVAKEGADKAREEKQNIETLK